VQGRSTYTMLDDDETVIMSGLLHEGTFDLEIQSNPRQLELNIYTAGEIERVVCNGQEVTPQHTGDHVYTARLRMNEMG